MGVKVREIIMPMLARKLYMSADDMYGRYKRIKLRQAVVLQDSNFELWLDHFFAVYDNPNAARKFNSKEYQLFEKIDVNDFYRRKDG